MHAQLRHADVGGAHAQFRRGDRADGGAAAHVGAGDDALAGNAGALADAAKPAGGFAAGGVTLVAVDLDDRARVQQRAVRRLVFVRVIRMHAVGVVGRNQHGMAQRARQIVAAAAQPPQHRLQKRAVGAAGRDAADFFVVVQRDDVVVLFAGILGREQCLHRGVTTQQIVQPRRGDELALQPDHFGRLAVIQAQIKRENLFHFQARVLARKLFAQQFIEVREIRPLFGAAQNRRQFFLFVDAAVFIDAAVQMNRQTRNEGDWPRDVDQAAAHRAVRIQRHPPGQAESAVKPRREQRAAIHFGREFGVAVAGGERVRFEF